MLALLRSPQEKVLLEAAVERGWITLSKTWKVSLYDDEIEEYVCSYFDDKADAEEEFEECLYGGTPGKLEEVILPVARQPLRDRWAIYFRRPLDKMMAEEFAILQLVEEQEFYDGAWWNEKYDPVTLSAPRGVIFINKLKEWIARPVNPEDLE
jgi:hypothetical protein